MFNCKKITTILWDVDGTLIDFEESENLAFHTCFEKHNIDITDNDFEIYKEINRNYWHRFDNGEITKDIVYVNRFLDFFKHLNIENLSAECFNTEYQQLLGECCVLFYGAYELCKKLSEKGYRQYAVSNGSEKAQRIKLNKTGLDKIFDGIFISDVIGYAKPSPLFFEYVFERIENLVKKETLLIGDNPICDIDGGNKAGVLTCLFDPAKKGAFDIVPTFTVHSMSDIEKLLI